MRNISHRSQPFFVPAVPQKQLDTRGRSTMMWKLVTNEVGILMDEQLGTGVREGLRQFLLGFCVFLTQPSRLNG